MPSVLDLETDAIVDLGARIRRLRRRVLLPAIIAALVAGHLSLLAHVLGYSSIVGRLSDGSYFVSKLTVLLALILPLPPIVAPACVAYLVLRGRMREAWARDHVARGLPAEVAARNARRFG